jgi:hypothetical protein
LCYAKFGQFSLFRVVKCIKISRRYLANSGLSVAFELCIEEPSPLTKLSHKWNIEQYFLQLEFGFYKRHGKDYKDHRGMNTRGEN